MPDTKISAAADPGALVATDKVPIARSASTTAYAATMAEIATWANTNLPVASTTVAGTVKVDGTSITIASGVISSASAPPASTAPPLMDGTAAAGGATAWSRGDHVHPSDTSRAPLASPTFTGTPAAPTATTGTNTTQIATTAFVQSQMVASGAGVSTFNTRAGAVVLQQSDITAVGALHDVGRNRLHNAGFSINQRGYVSGTALAAAAYAHDRWKAGAGGCTYTFTQNQPATTITITAGSLQQVIEALDVEGGTYTLSWTGTAQGRVGAGSYAASPVTATGLTANTAITVEFNAGTLGTVQWESGNTSTPYERQSMRYDLANCQRFYHTANFQFNGYNAGGGGNAFGQTLTFPVQMRATPTVTPTFTTQSNCAGGTSVSQGPLGVLVYSMMTVTGSGFFAGSYIASADL